MLVLSYAALVVASLVYLGGLPALPVTFYKTTSVSFARLTYYLILPHVTLFAPLAVIGALLVTFRTGHLAIAAVVFLLLGILPMFAWLTGVRYWNRRMFPSLFYLAVGVAGMFAVALQPLVFLGVAIGLLLWLYHAARLVYEQVGIDEFTEET